MYGITSTHANRLMTHGVFPQALAPTVEGQRLIRNAERDGYEVRCLCTGTPSSPLHSRRSDDGILHLCRAKGTEYEHVRGCKHGDSTRIADAYGAPAGSIVELDGNIIVDFDLLFPNDDMSPGDGGEWQGDQRDHGAALRALMWLLLVESGLHGWWPRQPLGDPWEALLRGAKSIKVSRGGTVRTLADLLLTPVDARQHWEGERDKRNYAKLCEAAKTTKRVLVACPLPAFGRDHKQRHTVDLGHPLDLRVWGSPALLARAMGQTKFAGQRHAGKHPVLAFGSASAKKPKDERASARMNQLLLMPIGPGLLPLPTQEHVDGFARSWEAGTFFGVAPNDDPMIAMRSSRKG